jgi:hypothetical protein
MSLHLLHASARPGARLTRGRAAPRPKSWVGAFSAVLVGLLLATTQAKASLIVLDPGAEPLRAPGLAVAGDWIARHWSGVDKGVGWALFPVNGQSCCALGDTIAASAVRLAGPVASAAPKGNVLTLDGPARRAGPKVSSDVFGGPTGPEVDPGLAHGEKNLRSMVAAGLARGADWSMAVALRDTVLPEFDLGHCGNNQALCSTWVDSPEVIAVKRVGGLGSRALAPDRFLGPSVNLPELTTASNSEKP